MGADWYSHTIVGVKLNHNDCYAEVRTRVCKHDLPDSQYDYCPKCGKPSYQKEKRLLEVLEDEGNWQEGISQCESDEGTIFVGQIIKSRYGFSHNAISFMPIVIGATEIRRESLQTCLEKYGLWDESQFGIWNVLHCSY